VRDSDEEKCFKPLGKKNGKQRQVCGHVESGERLRSQILSLRKEIACRRNASKWEKRKKDWFLK